MDAYAGPSSTAALTTSVQASVSIAAQVAGLSAAYQWLSLYVGHDDPIAFASLDTRGMHRLTADSVTTSESAALAFGQTSVDALLATDGYALAFSGVYQDSLNATDQANVTTDYQFSFGGYAVSDYFLQDYVEDQTVTVSDSYALSFSTVMSDSSVVSDGLALVYTTGFSDGAISSDSSSFTWSTPFSDGAAASDVGSIALSKVISDASAAADAGSLFYLNYVDGSYLAGDYVGIYTTF
jgi:hypothetical protein